MITPLGSLFSLKFRPVPTLGPEGLATRLLFAVLVNWMMPQGFHFASQARPTGLAHFFDLTFLSQPGAMMWVRIGLALLSIPYLFSLGLSVVLPLMTLLHVMVFTYNNSQGYTHHGNQIISLILLAQTFVVLFLTIHRWVKHRPYPMRSGLTRDSYLLYYSQVIIAGVYVTSAVSKMRESDFRWVQNLPNISVQLIKTHRQDFYSNPARSEIRRDADVPMAKWMLENPNSTRLFLGGGLLLEAFAFLCLANRGWAFLIGAMLISMHWIIGKVMRLYFDLNSWAALVFLINIPFWIIWFARRRQLRAHVNVVTPGEGI
ncbi:MAG: hypothetical protein ACR2OZ_03390 [Verrucomicrobiales bacterium]